MAVSRNHFHRAAFKANKSRITTLDKIAFIWLYFPLYPEKPD